MPSAFTRAFVGAALSTRAPREFRGARLPVALAVAAALPDIDVIGMRLGIPYPHPLGHRAALTLSCATRTKRQMAELEIGFLLPLPGSPRAVFEGDYSYEGGRLVLDGTTVLQAHSRRELESGVASRLAPGDVPIRMWLTRSGQGRSTLHVAVDERVAAREDRVRARPSRSAWVHAGLALGASAAGFVASYLYLLRAWSEPGDWALKMANHMAGWHLLLTFTLFPASVWGQRIGIRIVQVVSLVFFFIHLGIALANIGPDGGGGHGGAIAIFNGLSGLLFLAATLYGNRAYRDMDPAAAWRAGRARPLERD